MAAANGNLAVLQWDRAQGCPWDSDTCAYAEENGLLEVLQWAVNNGCPCNTTVRITSALINMFVEAAKNLKSKLSLLDNR